MNKSIYKVKPTTKTFIKNKISQKELAEKVGVSRSYLNEILNNSKRRNVSKSLAYFICKAVDEDLEIEDLFYT